MGSSRLILFVDVFFNLELVGRLLENQRSLEFGNQSLKIVIVGVWLCGVVG